MSGIRLARAILASLIVIVGSTPSAWAAEPAGCPSSATATQITGRNNAAIDVAAVQAAADNGGTVRLIGTFDFGDSGRVLLNHDVAICGEVDDSGTPRTVISGGEWTFHTPYPSTMPPAADGPKVSIEHIHFIGARGTAIHLAYSGGASLRDNVIDQMRFRKTPPSDADCNSRLNPGQLPPRFVGCERAAIVVGPELLRGAGFATNCSPAPPIICQYVPHLISGELDVSDNTIDVSGSEPTSLVRATGMFVSMYVGADVRIERNLVAGSTRTGLAIHDGIADGNGRGSVLIAGNVVRSQVRDGFNFNLGPRAPIGIVTGFNNNPTYGTDPNRQMIPVVIRGNTIDIGNELNPGSTPPMGIVNIWNGDVITRNSITVHARASSTTDRLSTSGGILATASYQLLTHNIVSGEGCNAIRIGGTVPNQERRASVGIANMVTRFTPLQLDPAVTSFNRCADVWLEPNSHNNTMVGNSGSVIDDGFDNAITGFGSVMGGVGNAVSDAEHYAQDVTLGFD